MHWPRLQLIEIGDQPWCPSWLHQHEQFSLTQLWNLRVPGWGRRSLATQACRILEDNLHDLPSYTVVDICAGAGGPTPVLEAEVNSKAVAEGRDPVRFILTDIAPPVDEWKRISAKQPNISYVRASVDARAVGRLADADSTTKECRVFNLCFHHFDDRDAAGVLRRTVQSADAFIIFEITTRELSTCICTVLVFFWAFYVTLLWYWRSPVHLAFTFALPLAPLTLWIDGFISCLRTRTPQEIDGLLSHSGLDLNGWRFRSGQRAVHWPFITLYYYVGVKE